MNSPAPEGNGRVWRRSLDLIDAAQIYPRMPVTAPGKVGPTVEIDGRPYLSFTSNDYLGLSAHPETRMAAIRAIEAYGLGPGHSRALGGTPAIVAELENVIARWTGFEDCVTFPTGYMASVSVIRALVRPLFGQIPGEEPLVFADQYCHGSLIDGCKLASVRVIPFRHNDLDDLTAKLERFQATERLIVTEGVFCLEGALIELDTYVTVAKQHGCLLLVDDAHGVGIMGAQGGGVASSGDLASGVDVYMGSMDKALGSTGGFLCGSSDMIRFLRVACRSQILSSCLPTVVAGGVLKSIELIRQEPNLRTRTLAKAQVLVVCPQVE